jgi:hypothetical protein
MGGRRPKAEPEHGYWTGTVNGQEESTPIAYIARFGCAFFCTDLAEEPRKHGDFSEKYHECGLVAPLPFSLYWQKIRAASVGGSP